jgi:hypothetical protein
MAALALLVVGAGGLLYHGGKSAVPLHTAGQVMPFNGTAVAIRSSGAVVVWDSAHSPIIAEASPILLVVRSSAGVYIHSMLFDTVNVPVHSSVAVVVRSRTDVMWVPPSSPYIPASCPYIPCTCLVLVQAKGVVLYNGGSSGSSSRSSTAVALRVGQSSADQDLSMWLFVAFVAGLSYLASRCDMGDDEDAAPAMDADDDADDNDHFPVQDDDQDEHDEPQPPPPVPAPVPADEPPLPPPAPAHVPADEPPPPPAPAPVPADELPIPVPRQRRQRVRGLPPTRIMPRRGLATDRSPYGIHRR